MPFSSLRHPGRVLGRVLLSAVLTSALSACATSDQTPGAAAAEAAPSPIVVESHAPDAPVQAQASPAPTPARPGGLGSYLAGRVAHSQADAHAAAEYYLAALAFDPENVELIRRAYALMVSAGRVREATLLAEALLEIDPGDNFAPILLTVDAISRERHEEALNRLAGVADVGLNRFLVPLLAAWAHAGIERHDAALSVLEPLREDRHLAGLHHFHAGLISDLAGREDAARSFFEDTLESPGGVALRAVGAAASLALRQGRTGEARALYERYRAANPDTSLLDGLFARLAETPARLVGSPRAGAAEAMFGAASTIRQSGALETALLFSQLALHLDPELHIARVLVGDILQAQERPGEAHAAFASVPEDSDVAFPAHLRAALMLNRMDRPDDAVAAYRKLAQTHPERPEPWFDMADVLRTRGRYDEAVKAYDEAFQRQGTVEPHQWTLYYARGIALERAGLWDRAESDLLRALELEPDQPYVLNYIGYTWLEQNRNLDEAFAMIEKAVEQRPNDGYIVDSLGWAYFIAGDFDAALEQLERAVELQPNDPVINDHLGDAYWRTGRPLQARFQWKRALSLDPDPKDAEIIRDKLQNGLPPL